MNVIPTIISILIQTIENEEGDDADEGNDSDDDDKDENKILQQSALLDFAMGLIKHGDDNYICAIDCIWVIDCDGWCDTDHDREMII